VTVILPTYRRPDSLRRALAGLSAQTDPGVPWELVVIDNDDGGGAEAVLRAGASGLPSWRYVREERRGSAHARNRGIAEARGEIVAMTDDDCVPEREWLGRITAPILAGRCDATGGKVVLDPSVARPRWFDEEGIGGYLASWDPAAEERDLSADEFFITANAACRTEILRRSGGFDPALGPRGKTPLVADDNLLSRRIHAVGARIRHVPEAVVVHELVPERLNRRYLLRRAYAQGRSDWILDRDTLSQRRFGGARTATSWLGSELRARFKEGIFRPAVAFHAACDIARITGALRQAVAISLEQRR
jgi:glycosyltransferase involved in cell wall biosynthesis